MAGSSSERPMRAPDLDESGRAMSRKERAPSRRRRERERSLVGAPARRRHTIRPAHEATVDRRNGSLVRRRRTVMHHALLQARSRTAARARESHGRAGEVLRRAPARGVPRQGAHQHNASGQPVRRRSATVSMFPGSVSQRPRTARTTREHLRVSWCAGEHHERHHTCTSTPRPSQPQTETRPRVGHRAPRSRSAKAAMPGTPQASSGLGPQAE